MSHIQKWEYHWTTSELKPKPQVKQSSFWRNLLTPTEYEWVIYDDAEYWPLSEGLKKYGANGWELGGNIPGHYSQQPNDHTPDKDFKISSSKLLCIFKRPATQ